MAVITVEENPSEAPMKSKLSLGGFLFKFFVRMKAFQKIGSAFWCLVLLGLFVLKNMLFGPLNKIVELDTKFFLSMGDQIAYYTTLILSPLHIYKLGNHAESDAALSIKGIEAPYNLGLILGLSILHIFRLIFKLLNADWSSSIKTLVFQTIFVIFILGPMMMLGSLISNFNKGRYQ